jgi:site-specific recombinase XerD
MAKDLIPVDAGDPFARVEALREEFLAGKKSPHTVIAYKRDLRLWLDWCRARGVDPLDTWPNHAMRWSVELAEGDPVTGRKPEAGTTRDRRLGAVSSWYRWLIRHQAAPRNPVASLLREERPKRAPRRAPALSNIQAEKLLVAADADTPRAAAIVYLLTYTGIRVGELLAANVGDVVMTDGEMYLQVRGKGDGGRQQRLNPYVMDRLNAWAKARPDAQLLPVLADQAGAGRDLPLFTTSRGKRLVRTEVRRLLQRLAKEAGLPPVLADRLTPHSTRATYATSSIAGNLSLRAVQVTMGHASPITTGLYDRSEVTPDRDPAIRLLGIIHPPTPDDQRT